jgi:hypothetical protein
VHTFTATLTKLGAQSITVTDNSTPTLVGTEWNIAVGPGSVTHFALAGFPALTAGVTGTFSVTAEDHYGNISPGYTGTVTFTSSAAQASLPNAYTFNSADAGVHVFTASLQTAGSQSITATDTMHSSVTGTQSGIAIGPTNPVRFTVAAPASVTVGAPFTVTVTAWDAYGNVATNYTGTISFVSTDSAAILPGPYTFAASDRGVHTFTNGVTLQSTGAQTVTATGSAVPAGITSWWTGNGTANDTIGGNNGSLVGGATFAPGLVGQAFNFNGTSAAVNIPYSSSLALNTFTVEAWVNPVQARAPWAFSVLGSAASAPSTSSSGTMVARTLSTAMLATAAIG